MANKSVAHSKSLIFLNLQSSLTNNLMTKSSCELGAHISEVPLRGASLLSSRFFLGVFCNRFQRTLAAECNDNAAIAAVV